jgi:DNA (cytosine-5)-methyltransferase 1
VLSLFTGAGGLDRGLEEAGFETKICVEIDQGARKTLTKNRPHWTLADPGDIHEIEPSYLLRQVSLKPREVTLLAGGPPCQPFSKSGYWSRGDSLRLEDPRAKTLEAYVHVVEAALPKVLLLENVKGLAFVGKDEGLKLLKKKIASINRRHRTKYKLQILHLNAADYGVPQIRERVFIVAHREGLVLKLPKPTHGPEGAEPYRTAWDAIGDLNRRSWSPNLKPAGKWADLLPSIPEGQNYLWHTPRNAEDGSEPLFGWRTRFWTFLLKLAKNQPAWTIQADPGPATGPFHWRSRLLSTKELARLQTFPDDYKISGDRRSAHRQIGNAVPCAIAEMLGLEIRRQFLGERVRRTLRLIPKKRKRCPAPTTAMHVPAPYLKMRGDHADHPGTALGPGAARRTEVTTMPAVAAAV